MIEQRVTAILPCTDLDAAQSLFERLGFAPVGTWIRRRQRRYDWTACTDQFLSGLVETSRAPAASVTG